MTELLTIRGVSKRFPGVHALTGVDFDLRPGEVHALVGENGAGKSTLMKILAGLQPADEGTILHRGAALNLRSPLEARERGILLIHQELSLSPQLSAAENIYLGAWPANAAGILRKGELNRRAGEALAALGCDIDPRVRVGSLSIARKQMVEIARIHAFNANVVILDEPTASLTDAERDQLFATIRGLKARGVGIIYISHKMDEIFTITDRITVLRDGVVQGTLATAGTDADRVTQMMIGRKLEAFFTRAPEHFGDEVLRVKGLTRQREFHDLSLSVRQGEVLGLYGLIGAGRSEVVETLFGIRRAEAGKLWWLGQECAFPTPRQAIDMGLCLAPENRKEQGLVLGLGGRDNIALPSLGLFSRLGVMRRAREQATYVTWRDTLRIKVSGPGTLLRTLSGGNQQKFVLAKWLCRKPKLLILDEPTRGIDVGSKAAIHQLIAALAGQGLAVIVISSEMPEVLGVSHRILTMADGRLTGEFAGSAMTEQNLIRAVSHHAA